MKTVLDDPQWRKKHLRPSPVNGKHAADDLRAILRYVDSFGTGNPEIIERMALDFEQVWGVAGTAHPAGKINA